LGEAQGRDLAEAVLPKLVDLQATVVSGEVTESRFYLKAVTARIRREVKPGDVVQAGIVVSNSETGQGALRVEALDYRLVCLNGMIREAAVRKAHLGRSGLRGLDAIEDAREFYRNETRVADDRAFFLKVQDATGAMFDPARFTARLAQYAEAAAEPIGADPVKAVEATAKRFGFTDGERVSVVQHLIRAGARVGRGAGSGRCRVRPGAGRAAQALPPTRGVGRQRLPSPESGSPEAEPAVLHSPRLSGRRVSADFARLSS